MNFVYDPSLVLYLPLYERDGNSLVSRDAYGHLGSVNGALWRPYGRYFDGTDDQIDCGDDPALDITTAITIELWFRSTNYSGIRDFCGRGDTEAYNLRQSYNGNGTLTLTMKINGTGRHLNYGASAYYDGIWHHLAGTFDGSRRVLYLGGRRVAEDASYSGTIDTTTTHLFIGSATGSSSYFNGDIGEMRLYNRALTPQEIEQNFLATKWRYR